MMVKESTMKFDNQDEFSENVTLYTEKKHSKLSPFITSSSQKDDVARQQPMQILAMQESLKDFIDKNNNRAIGLTKSDTTLSIGEIDMNTKYTSKSKHTYNDLSSLYSAPIFISDPQYICKGDLLDKNGNTYSALNQNTGHLHAIKTYSKEIMQNCTIDQVVAEKWIELSTRSYNLCRCYGMFSAENNGQLDVVYDHISGESLQKIIASFNHFKEGLVGVFARQIFKGLDQLHSNDLTHGNLKISNILIDNDALLKITDLNIFVKTNEILERLKSLSSAPELLIKNELTSKSDVWSAGIVLIEMVAGNPWIQQNGELMTVKQVIESIKKNKWFQVPSSIKTDFKDFLSHALEINPQKRWSSSDLLKHKFLKDAEQEEQSLMKQASVKDRSVYSQTSMISRRGTRTGSKLFEMRDKELTELKSLKTQKSDGAHKSKFFNPSTSMRDLNPDDYFYTKQSQLDTHSPLDTKLNIPIKKSSLTKTSSISRKITNELGRGYTNSSIGRGLTNGGFTNGSKVSYIKMLSVGENESYVDDKTFSQSQIFNQLYSPQSSQLQIALASQLQQGMSPTHMQPSQQLLYQPYQQQLQQYQLQQQQLSQQQQQQYYQQQLPNPQTTMIIANSIMEDGNEQPEEQVQEKLFFIEQKMFQIMDNSDQVSSDNINSPKSFRRNDENKYSFIRVPSHSVHSVGMQSQISKQQIQNKSSLKIRVNDQPLDEEFIMNSSNNTNQNSLNSNNNTIFNTHPNLNSLNQQQNSTPLTFFKVQSKN